MQTTNPEARWLEITLKAGWDIVLARQRYINLPESKIGMCFEQSGFNSTRIRLNGKEYKRVPK
ncbi:hypothetical protein ACTXT7_009204 [Hymenolepis weldensis]